MVTAFKGIFTMSTFEASLVQFAYFGAYFCLALPTAFLNERFGYKVGVLTGLGLAAIGAFGFYPAAKSLTFGVFLIALFILAAGLSVLETSANPFAIAMGPEGTATRRLNLAQSFNPLGTNLGVLLAAVVLPKMNPATPEQRATMPHDQLVTIQTAELNAIMNPYLGLAVALVIIWIGLFIKKVPRSHEEVASTATTCTSATPSAGCTTTTTGATGSSPNSSTSEPRSAPGPTSCSMSLRWSPVALRSGVPIFYRSA